MTDERSKNMRDLLFALPITIKKQDRESAADVSNRLNGAMQGKVIPTMGYIPKRCLCCGGIGINHDE